MVTQKLAFCWTASLVEEKKWAKSFGLLGRNLALPVRLDPHDLKSSERKKHWEIPTALLLVLSVHVTRF